MRGEGESRVVNLAERPLPDGSGSIVLVHDVTAAHRLQQQLEHHKRLSAMGEMAAGISHEIRNPLGIIRSSAELLKKKVATGRAMMRATPRLARREAY